MQFLSQIPMKPLYCHVHMMMSPTMSRFFSITKIGTYLYDKATHLMDTIIYLDSLCKFNIPLWDMATQWYCR